MKITILYMLAGLSERFLGKPKGLSKVGPNQETLMEISLNQALEADITKIIFIVSKETHDAFKEKFQNSYKGIPIQYAIQIFNPEKRDRPWGTLDALCSAKEIIDSPFIVCNGDDIYGKESFKILVNHLKNNSNSATIGQKIENHIPEEGEVNRGIFQVNPDNTINSIKETYNISKSKLKSMNLTNALSSGNIFAFHPNSIIHLSKALTNFKEKYSEDKTIESLLSEEISRLIKSKKLVMKIYQTNEKVLGITNPDDELKVRKELSKNDSIL